MPLGTEAEKHPVSKLSPKALTHRLGGQFQWELTGEGSCGGRGEGGPCRSKGQLMRREGLASEVGDGYGEGDKACRVATHGL